MPSSAIITASSSITVTKVSSLSMNPLASFSNPFWSSTLASGWSARAAAMASWTSALSAPAARVTRPEATSCGPAKAFCSARLITKLSLIQPLPS